MRQQRELRWQSHSLRGLCGLKYLKRNNWQCLPVSQPARAVWIEIADDINNTNKTVSHSLRGLCGLKSVIMAVMGGVLGHSLRGLCGLKSTNNSCEAPFIRHSLRGLCGLKL